MGNEELLRAYIWLYMAMYEYIWLYVAIFEISVQNAVEWYATWNLAKYGHI